MEIEESCDEPEKMQPEMEITSWKEGTRLPNGGWRDLDRTSEKWCRSGILLDIFASSKMQIFPSRNHHGNEDEQGIGNSSVH